MALGDISNPMIADIAGAMSFRQAQMDKEEQKRNEVRIKQLIAQAIPDLPEGSPVRELMMRDPVRGAAFAQAMDIPLNRGDQFTKFARDVNQAAQIAHADPIAAHDYVGSLIPEYEKAGMSTTMWKKWHGAVSDAIASGDNGALTTQFNALGVMKDSLNPALKKDMVKLGQGEKLIDPTTNKVVATGGTKNEHIDAGDRIITGHYNDNGDFVKTGEIAKGANPTQSGTAEGGLSEDSVDQMAQRLLNGDKKSDVIGNFGRGAQGAVDLRRIQNRMAELAKQQNIDPSKLQNIQMDAAAEGKAIKDFTTGKQGNNVRSFNTALEHLDTLHEASQALNNGDIQLFNKIGNAWNSATGKAAPTNFEATKKIVADEIVKAIVGTGGGVTDREKAAETIQSANSPAKLNGAIEQYKELMAGQLKGLNQQYKASTSRDDFSERFLTEKSKKYVSPESKKDSGGAAKSLTYNPQTAAERLKAFTGDK